MRRFLFTLTALIMGCSGKETTAPDPVPQNPVMWVSIESPGVLDVGARVQLKVILRDHANFILSNRALEFTSSDESVATVDQSGFVSALVGGNVVITAKSEGRLGSVILTINAVPLTCSPERVNVCAADETFALVSVDGQLMPVHSPWGFGDWGYDSDAGTWDLIKWSITFYPEGSFFSEMIHRAASGATMVEKSGGKYVRSTSSILFSVQNSSYSMAIVGDSLNTQPGTGRKFTFVRVINPIGQ